jgi:ligand-binding sensor domain-containing protein/serine phosphatase RsbU (regulator of sigma subunit)
MRISLRYLICSCTLLFALQLHSQKQWGTLKFKRFGVDQGLPVTTAFSIVQDQKGFIWVATIDGLMRYDGYHFVAYKNNYNDSASLSDNTLSTLLVGKDNKLWAGTYSGGLNCLDISTGKFKRYQNIPGNNSSLSNNRVWAVCEHDHIIWAGTENGLNAIDLNSGTVTRYFHDPKDPKSLCHNTVLSVMLDKSGRLWIGTTRGLSRAVIDKTGKITEFVNYKHDPSDPSSLSSNVVMSLFSNKNKTIFIGTNDGLCRYNPARDNFIVTRFGPQSDTTSSQVYSYLNSYGVSAIRSMYEDRHHNLWLCTDKGLKIYNPTSKEYICYNSDNGNSNSLSADLLCGIMEDKNGNVWIGTIIGGLNKVDLKPQKFKLVQTQNGNPYKLCRNNIRSIFKDSKNTLWVGTFEGGVCKLENGAGGFVPLKNKVPESENIWSIYEDKKGNMWFGSSNGVYHYDPASKKCELFAHSMNDNCISNNIIRCITEDSKGSVWIGTEGGLNRFDPSTGKWWCLRSDPSKQNSLSNNTVWCIRESWGALWVGTDNGLNKLVYDSLKKEFTVKHFLPKKDDPKSLSNKAVRSIWIDRDSVFWVGTSNGLNKFDPIKETFARYNESNGLANSYIYGVVGDNNHQLWISTNNGVSRFNTITEKFSNFGKLDGLQNNEFNTGAYFRTQDDEMFFGGPDGFNSFYPDSLLENKTPPDIVITSIRLFGEELVNEKQPYDISEIELSHNQNVISFEFAATDFTQPEKNNYAYILEGFDRNWVSSGNRRFVNYTNLDPGVYTFKVRASNADGTWNNTGIAIKLRIVPPFWKAWWFRAGLAILLVLIISGLYIQRVRRFRKVQSLLQHEVAIKTKELQEQNILIDKKNKNITASIEYARRIQDSILPGKEKLKDLVKDSFVFYKPKDIVSGDFYWFHEQNDILYVVAADCTGHGVPGAFMSLIGYNLLKETVKKRSSTDPATILAKLHKGLVNVLKQDKTDTDSVDGMDIAFCMLDLKTKILTFSSTDRPLNVIRKGELKSYREGEYPLGYITSQPQKFQNNVIQLESGDVFYIYTDGYCDQFGGDKNQKYMEGHFEDLLLKIHNEPMNRQCELVNNEITNWMNSRPQIDDMLVIGIKI